MLGYGILDIERRGRPSLVACGVVRLPPRPLSVRLETIYREVRALLLRYGPGVLAIEEVFHGKNFQSVLKVGEARGVVVLAAQMSGLEIREYPPAVVKRSATGHGDADKSQVQSMMARFFGSEVVSEPEDASDALAVAFCHGQRLWRASPNPKGGRGAGGGEATRSEGRVRRATPRQSAAQLVQKLLGKGKARVFRGTRFRRVDRTKIRREP